jgi:hypothetical protein
MAETPSAFDWVDARQVCSAEQVLERLAALAERDVATRNKFIGKDGYDVSRHRGNVEQLIGFRVEYRYRQRATRPEDIVIIRRHRDELHVQDGVGDTTSTATVVMVDDPVEPCRINEGGELLYDWQFLRRHLETLLFAEQEH